MVSTETQHKTELRQKEKATADTRFPKKHNSRQKIRHKNKEQTKVTVQTETANSTTERIMMRTTWLLLAT